MFVGCEYAKPDSLSVTHKERRGGVRMWRKLNFWPRQQSILEFSLLKCLKPCERDASYREERIHKQHKSDQFTYPVTSHRFKDPKHLPVSFLRLKGFSDWPQIKGKYLFSLSGIPNWYIFCPNLDRQPPSIQQYNENTYSEQQHGRLDMDPRHHLPKL